MAQPLETTETKSNDDDIDGKFWDKLQKANKMTLCDILETVRNIDKKTGLTIGKFHDKNQEDGGILNFLFSTSDTRKNEMMRDKLCSYTIFLNNKLSLKLKQNWINSTTSYSSYIDRSVGVIVGMGIGDAVGHPLEFVPITLIEKDIDSRPRFNYIEQKYYNEYNKFKLQRGQWTDDAAMGLCQADSLIINDKYDGSDIRIRFWNWWQNGYNNAFRNDKTRSSSCGLGGNISSSIYSCKYGVIPNPRYEVDHDREDSGNGSLMRLGAMPVYFHNNIENARKYSFESSFTTHPGYIAAESCSFMAFIIVNAIHAPINNENNKQNEKLLIDFIPSSNVKKFMDIICNQYMKILENENDIISAKINDIKTKYLEKINGKKNNDKKQQKNNDIEKDKDSLKNEDEQKNDDNIDNIEKDKEDKGKTDNLKNEEQQKNDDVTKTNKMEIDNKEKKENDDNIDNIEKDKDDKEKLDALKNEKEQKDDVTKTNKMEIDNKENKDNKENEDELNNKKELKIALKKNSKYKLLKRERAAKRLILRLIKSEEPKESLEECWNWKNKYGELPIIDTFYQRSGGRDVDRWKRKKYNGYPVNADYWGSYCMDGLAMALHCVYNSNNFADSIEKCVNLLGDADSTGSIGGQIAGAIYGYQSIINDKKQKFLFKQLIKWDDYDFAFRGVLLYILGDDKLKKYLIKTK